VPKSPTKTGEREKIAVWLEHDQLKALRASLERDGVPIAEQIRRGVDLWLEKRRSNRLRICSFCCNSFGVTIQKEEEKGAFLCL
jgi:hypothetical protein